MRLLPLILVLSLATLATEWLSPILLAGSGTLQRHVFRRTAPVAATSNLTPADYYNIADVESFALNAAYDIKKEHIQEVQLTFGPRADGQDWLRHRFYLRTLAFDAFVNNRWSRRATPDQRREATAEGEPVIIQPATTNAIRYTLRIRSHHVLQLPYIPVLHSISLPSLIEHPDGVFAATDVPASPFLVYSAVSSPISAVLPTPGSLSIAEPSEPWDEYLRLPDDPLTSRIRELARTLAGDATDPATILARMLDHLHTTCTYSLRVRNPDVRDPVENFLFHEQAGHCELFATAFTLLLRAAGIPARLATGYCGGEYNVLHDTLVFFRDDAHAWVEVYAGDQGWIIVDPTPSAPDAPLPPKTVSQPDAMQLKLAPVPASRFFRWLRKHTSPPVPLRVGAAVLCAMLIVLITTTLRNQRSVRRTVLAPDAVPPSFLRAFLRHFARHGHPRRRGQTLRQYVDSLKSAGHVGDEFDPLVDYVYAISYHGKARSRTLERQFMARIRQSVHKG
jgi:hypothetical protein